MTRSSFNRSTFTALAFMVAHSVPGQTWTNTGPADGAHLIACSADGTKLFTSGGADGNFGIYISTNAGGNWAPTTLVNDDGLAIYSVACSSDGGTVFALSRAYGYLYISTNAGLTWLTNDTGAWDSVLCSADGTKVVLGAFAAIAFSTNTGLTFTTNSYPGDRTETIAMSADGSKLVRIPQSLTDSDFNQFAFIYRSVDFGTTWIPTSAPSNLWMTVASSADGTQLAAEVYNGTNGLWTSTNSGTTWVSHNIRYAGGPLISSADGTRLATPNYISLDSGKTLIPDNGPDNGELLNVLAMSADGSFLAENGSNGVYTTYIPAQPSLRILTGESNLVLSWPVPSAGFVLQENSRLGAANWVIVTHSPTVSGYFNQVTVPPPATGDAYYRLVHPP